MHQIKITLTSLALAGALAACGGGETTGGDEEHSSGGEHAVTSASYEGPMTSQDAAAGEVVYQTFCQGCHQDGTGGEGAAPAIAGIGWSPARMRQQVREGEDSMPAMSASVVSDAALEDLLAYLAGMGGVAAE